MDVLGTKSGDKPKGSVILCLNEYAVGGTRRPPCDDPLLHACLLLGQQHRE